MISLQLVYYKVYMNLDHDSYMVGVNFMQLALDHGRSIGLIKEKDRIVVCQKLGDSSMVKIVQLD